MPPATQPIPVQVLDNLEAALALPDGGSGYFYDVNVVREGESVLDQIVEPAFVLGDVGAMGRLVDEKQGGTLFHTNFHWRIPVYGVVPYSSNQAEANRNLLRLVHDLEKAVMVDYTLGGKAALAMLVGFEVMGPPTAGDTRPWFGAELDIQMQMRLGDMLSI